MGSALGWSQLASVAEMLMINSFTWGQGQHGQITSSPHPHKGPGQGQAGKPHWGGTGSV